MSDPQFVIVRGQRIEEIPHGDLVELHRQIEGELPQEYREWTRKHHAQLEELEAIEDELEKRR
jgi:hypothetical protein